jgi:hypothetical protein
MIFFKSARSDVKTRQNPPSRIGQIRQKSVRNWDDFRPFFTLRVVFVAFLVRILPYLRSGKGEIYFFFRKYFAEYLFILKLFYAKKSEKQVVFLLIKAPKPPESARSARQKQTHTKFVKSARNLPEIGSLPEIFFARQTTFKSARILQIWRRKPPSGNADTWANNKKKFRTPP